jgi:hypothetical protein
MARFLYVFFAALLHPYKSLCILHPPSPSLSLLLNSLQLAFSSKGDETINGVLMSNTLMHTTGLMLNVEPFVPLLGRRIEGEMPPTITHF